ncbi:autotransporter domain-containing protein [Chelativorans sp. YIM 93263]|uniref:autotransporter domain-containing protein n=1 Tax=Chelativorans sp. YIM 93263 TaxID=2906648 RepID=UPI002377F3E1|nr:autotransporter domain-containing protein [Chelativorans sp. YIM 93263]
MTVKGSDSTWTSDGQLNVGNFGAGELTVSAGGAVSNTYGYIGSRSTGDGSVTVTGTESDWTNSEGLFVGFEGTGELTISDEGSVSSNDYGYIGYFSNSSGRVTVTGNGSTLTISDLLHVGSSGTGELTVSDGGRVVQSTGIDIAAYGNSTGTLNIGAAAGDPAVAPGTLDTPSVTFGSGDGALVFNHTGADYAFAPSISGEGAINVHSGATRLTADSSGFSGTTTVDRGRLSVIGTLGGDITVATGQLVVNGSIVTSSLLAVEDGGALGGSGIVGKTTVADGGTIAPGNSIGTLTVDGDLALSSGSLLDYELGGPGSSAGTPGTSDRIDVTGDLTLDGTLNLLQSDDATDGTAGVGYYRLMTYDGALTDNTLDVGVTPPLADPAAYEVQTGGGNVDLFVAAAGDDTLQHWQGGDGTWNASNQKWFNQGSTVPVAWAGNHAVFKNEPGGFNGGTITVEGTQGFKGLQFVDGGYRLAGDGALRTDAGGSEIRVLADRAAIATEVSGMGGISKTEAGTLVLEGANSYAGGTQLLSGAVEVSQDANLGAAAGGLTFNGGTLRVTGTGFTQTNRTIDWGANGGGFDIADAANTFTVGQNLTGDGDLLKEGAGTLVLSGTNSYGNTGIAAGELIGNAGSISGDIANAATVTFNQGTDATFAGTIAGLDGTDGQMVKDGTGTLTLAGTSALDWTVNAGGLTAAERFAGDVAIGRNGTFTFDRQDDAQYGGALSGSGVFTKAGDGALLYTGDGSDFAGTTTIAGGLLSVGTQDDTNVLGGSVDVLSGATLGGVGTVGAVTLASGATVAPGNSIGTLNVAGDITFSSGSTYEVEVDPAGADSDSIHATGMAHLNDASVVHVGLDGSYDPFSSYTILTADGGIDGTFADVTSVYAFLTPELSYGASTVDLALTRNDISFGDKARSGNQRSVAVAAESLGAGNDIYNAVAALPDNDAEIQGAFDQLSGEIHASAKTALIEDSRFVRDAVSDRIRAAFGDMPETGTPVLAYGPDGPRPPAAVTSNGPVAWGRAYGGWGKTDGDGNAAKLDRSTGGFLAGIDGAVTPNLRLGLLAGYGHSSFDVDDRASSGSSDNYHLGLYGGGRWDAVRLSGGLAYTWHDIETDRKVAFGGFSDRLSAHYDSGTFQAFGEAGYRIETEAASFEPFVGLAHVSLHTDGFAEDGGTAALSADSQTTSTTFTTLGVHASTDFDVGGMRATAHGTLGWRHAFGDTTPLSTHAFAGGDTFTVAGVPIAEDAAIIEAGLDFDITDNATLGVAYSGQIATDAQQHGFNAKLSVKF